MIRHKAFLPHRAILRSYANLSILLEKRNLCQVGCRASSQQKDRCTTSILYLLTEIEQWGNADTTSNKQNTLCRMRQRRKCIAQRKYTIQHISLVQACERTRTFSYGCNKQPQLITVTINEINGNRTAKKGRRRAVHSHLYELTGKHLWKGLVVCQLNKDIPCIDTFRRRYLQIEDILLHLYLAFKYYAITANEGRGNFNFNLSSAAYFMQK